MKLGFKETWFLLQATRQQELITELEEELDNLQRQLEVKDSELELWKSGIRRLSKIWTPESTPGTFPPVTYIPSLFRIYSPCALFVEVLFFWHNIHLSVVSWNWILSNTYILHSIQGPPFTSLSSYKILQGLHDFEFQKGNSQNYLHQTGCRQWSFESYKSYIWEDMPGWWHGYGDQDPWSLKLPCPISGVRFFRRRLKTITSVVCYTSNALARKLDMESTRRCTFCWRGVVWKPYLFTHPCLSYYVWALK